MSNKMSRRVKILITTLFLIFSFTIIVYGETGTWDGQTKDTSWYSSGETAFEISTGEQLAGLAKLVNEGNDFAGKTIALKEDIDLGSKEWTTIGIGKNNYNRFDRTKSVGFNGTFEGSGRQIKNLKISKSEENLALFGYISDQGIVRDFVVDGTVSGARYGAGVAAACSGTIEKVKNTVDVAVDDSYAGGIVAQGLEGVRVKGCRNIGKITNDSKIQSSGKIAGIMGTADDGAGTILECSNSGNVSGYQYVAGILGGQFENIDIKGCYNSAPITAISFGKVYLGGIAGKSQEGTITDCYNLGDLHDAHWAQGHVRAIGGIAGSEEGRSGGTTAIRNCYSTGKITINTSNMVSGTNWIYMLGNISGGNSPGGANTQKYSNCYYQAGRIETLESENPAYQLVADIYKENPLVWDTNDIESKTEEELKSPTFTKELGGNFYSGEGSFPVLYWQVGRGPIESAATITSKIFNSASAKINLSASQQVTGEQVSFTITEIEDNKQVQKIEIKDAAGRKVSWAKTGEQYQFTMPDSAVGIVAYFENKVQAGANAYKVNMPANLDPIWSASIESSHIAGNHVKEGATVFVSASRLDKAKTASLEGILVKTESGEQIQVNPYDYVSEKNREGSLGISGVYSFTMPGEDVTIDLDMRYEALAVYQQQGKNGEPKKVKSYSREDMTTLAMGRSQYYSGYESDQEAFIGKAEQAVTMDRLLHDAEVSVNEYTTFEVVGIDGMNLFYTYDKLYGSPRYYYPNLISGASPADKAIGKVKIDPMFTIKGNMALASEGNVDEKTCDTLNAYRFVFGQTEKEFNNGEPSTEGKVTSDMPKHVQKLVIIDDAKGAVEKLLGKQAGIKVQPSTYSSAKVSWKKTPGADGYQIYRSTSNTSLGTKIAKIAKSTITSYVSKGLKTGTTYYYRVVAYKLVNNKPVPGIYSDRKAVKPILNKPTLKAKAGKKSAMLSWSKISGASGYQIYRSTKNKSGFKKVKLVTKGNTTRYTNKKLRSKKKYYYKVRAYRSVGGKKVYSSFSLRKGMKAK